MRSLQQIKNLKGQKVLVRVDFNLPIKYGKARPNGRSGGRVEDDFRIKKTLSTILFLQKKGARIILITHLGKGGNTLLPVSKALNKFVKAKFIPDINGEKAQNAAKNLKDGEVILLENLRNDRGEKECNKIFALNLAKMADIYVNEAFPVSHREDASIVLLPKLLPSYAGFQLEEEVKNLSRAFQKPKRPFLFILGGAKFSTKIPLIEKYLELADHVFIGGALLNVLLQAKGYEIGDSLIEEGDYNTEKILKNDNKNKKLILPVDVAVKSGDKMVNRKINEVEKNEIILDVGEESVQMLAPYIKKSKLILWNGPLGKYEAGGEGATKKILGLVAASKAETIIGGGDTVEIISEMKMEDKFTFVSTGGGATLDFLANGTLPGIKALE